MFLMPAEHELPVSGGSCEPNPPATFKGLSLPLQRSDRFFQIFSKAGAGIAFCDAHGRLIECNDAFCRFIQRSQAWVAQSVFADFTHPEDRDREALLFAEILARQREDYSIEKRYLTGGGGVVWGHLNVSGIRDDVGRLLYFVGVVFDITARKHAEAQSLLYTNAFQLAGQAMMLTDANRRIIRVNQAFESVTGFSAQEVIGRNPSFLASGQTPMSTYKAMWRAVNSSGQWTGEVWDRRRNGEVYPKWLSISAIRDESGVLLNYLGCFSDVSANKAAEKTLSFLANCDALTGLPNRHAVHDRLQSVLQLARGRAEVFALMLINTDGFSAVNDQYGHQHGDAFLRLFASRLRMHCRDSDLVGRMGGDEFVVILTGLRDRQLAEKIIGKCWQAATASLRVNETEHLIQASGGVAFFPRDGDTVASLLAHANLALREVKRNGGNTFRAFSVDLAQRVLARQQLEQALPGALMRQEFSLVFQPQCRLSDTRVRSVEALLRWQTEDGVLISPDSFIPVAERSGYIHELGRWVIDAACRELVRWRREGFDGFPVAINISARQLASPDMVAQIVEVLGRYGLEPQDVELEITETTAMEDPESVILLLDALVELGVIISIDDFGTGFSSLAYLRRLPAQRLKIDRSFVRDLTVDGNDAKIVEATIKLAHELGLEVVAEGVETLMQRDFLLQAGCDVMQGYWLARPMPGDALLAWLHAGQPGGRR